MDEIQLMKGNEAIAEAAIRAGSDAYFGYPITPQSEIMEYLTLQKTEERTGMVVLQAESEIGAINMVYGAAGTGKRVMLSSSSPGISLIQEGMSYLAGGELPCLIINVMRGGPGLGTIQPSQGDYFQATRGGGHGDYRTLVLAPSSVQEMADFVPLGYELAFKYRNPVLILADGMIGQMMEKVRFKKPVPRLTEKQIKEKFPWAALGRNGRDQIVHKSVELDSEVQEQNNFKLIHKYEQMAREDVRWDEYYTEDAEAVIVAYGSASRIGLRAVEMARDEGLKLGMVRPVTLFPFPVKAIDKLADRVSAFLTVEMSAGQMVEDVRLAVNGKTKVWHFGRLGGIVPSPREVLVDFKSKMMNV